MITLAIRPRNWQIYPYLTLMVYGKLNMILILLKIQMELMSMSPMMTYGSKMEIHGHTRLMCSMIPFRSTSGRKIFQDSVQT